MTLDSKQTTLRRSLPDFIGSVLEMRMTNADKSRRYLREPDTNGEGMNVYFTEDN